jgi:hypothetical protein
MLSTGLILAKDDPDGWRIAGTGAVFNRRHTYVTAAHCVPDGADIAIVPAVAPEHSRVLQAQTVVRHPQSDYAVVTLDKAQVADAPGLPLYVAPTGGLIDGGDFVGHGYPVEGTENPVARTFKGHFMRYFGYEPPGSGPGYFAAEMSIPAPPGFSGGPLAYAARPGELIAVVTTNVDSEIILDRFEEVERDGSRHAERVTRVISYGIAAMVDREWLIEQAPPSE